MNLGAAAQEVDPQEKRKNYLAGLRDAIINDTSEDASGVEKKKKKKKKVQQQPAE